MNTQYITLGWSCLCKELFEEPSNRKFVKPKGGLWASTYTPNDEYVSDWERWCYDEQFFTGRMDIGVVFDLKKDSRIYTIDTYEDLVNLYSLYELKDTLDKSENEIFYISSHYLDFEKIANDYDVIHLTDKGQCETRLSYPYSLYGWDVESILVLNFDVINNQESIKIKDKEE